MTELDALAPAHQGRWTHDGVTVEFSASLAAGTVDVRCTAPLLVEHALSSAHIGESVVQRVTDLNLSQREFELVMVGLVLTTVSDPVQAWTTYYRNSLDDLLSGAADFAPVHARAEALVTGSVLDLGSCFGFFPLRLALDGVDVTATDLSAGTMNLLRTVAPHLGATLDVLTCDASGIPVPPNSADTVTALHLLEHVDEELGAGIIDEAIRIARRRVVIAVPYESEATACHGHVRTFDDAALDRIGLGSSLPYQVDEFHGGWLVLDTTPADARAVSIR
ncbi:mycofactocin oligosaccharide methyltransferase MftM [Rhodococcoides fascians]|uniref:mycofactocin oligosaccharide methyltransferase MftM n=1 Tax=Rhodococcoides fascians TaxID=1828 RepID=UPI00055D25A6|nr:MULTISPECIES: mycofactocin oligosaccharide methyltransferase MftM [Rhodococcus]OZE92086.1 class I SAM-dependent methyltransferase [Rhodococcus sp. 15-1189-1-1a]OZF21008.1 class I SAM-dependent methyltransferase [Rhodococcus sp. 14-2686-1-2]